MRSKQTKKMLSKKSTKKAAAPKAAATRAAGKNPARKSAPPTGPNRAHAGGDAPAGQRPAHEMPPVGTVIKKTDRYGAVRCECKVEETGFRYEGTVYRSLSAAAMAAAKDLRLTNKTQNGWTFWGLTKPPRPSSDPVEALERGWARYQGILTASKDRVTDENRSTVHAALRAQRQALEAALAQVG
jgi:Protein of unknown function (DUF2924)